MDQCPLLHGVQAIFRYKWMFSIIYIYRKSAGEAFGWEGTVSADEDACEDTSGTYAEAAGGEEPVGCGVGANAACLDIFRGYSRVGQEQAIGSPEVDVGLRHVAVNDF